MQCCHDNQATNSQWEAAVRPGKGSLEIPQPIKSECMWGGGQREGFTVCRKGNDGSKDRCCLAQVSSFEDFLSVSISPPPCCLCIPSALKCLCGWVGALCGQEGGALDSQARVRQGKTGSSLRGPSLLQPSRGAREITGVPLQRGSGSWPSFASLAIVELENEAAAQLASS